MTSLTPWSSIKSSSSLRVLFERPNWTRSFANAISPASLYILASAKRSGKHLTIDFILTKLTQVRIKRYKEFKEFNKRICVATDVFGRGIDIERINLAINYDLPADADSYLHRVGRAGRFGTKGLSISFVSSEQDETVLKEIESRFEAKVPEYPAEGVDSSSYMAS